MKYLTLLLIGTVAFGCADAFRSHEAVVARAGSAELSVVRLAEMVANARDLPVDRDVVELLAYRWAEVSAFAQRSATGDSLMDSLTIVAAMWPDTRGAAVDSFHQMVVASQVDVQAAQVDSAYRAGNLLIVGHIFKSVTDSMTPEERETQRSVAERLHSRLTDGSMDWDAANAQSDDQAAREQRGMLGVLQRGFTHPRFENAAFALAGGELSDVTETPAGYHIIYRPALEDVRVDFAGVVRTVFLQRQDSIYEAHLIETTDVSFRGSAVSDMREAIQFPFRNRGSDRVIATFRTGRLTVGEVIRWMQVLPPDVVAAVPSATDEEVLQLGRSLVARELIWRQADSAGITYTSDQFKTIAEGFGRQMEELRAVTQLYPDSLAHYQPDPGARQELASNLVDQYLERGVQDRRLLVPVPPFVAERLLEEIDWEVIQGGVQRATQQAAVLRAAMPPAAAGEGN